MTTDRFGNKLNPLSPADAKEFANRRQSDAVIQTRCEACGAWYETDRQSRDIIEDFACDCGARMKFYVPALDPGAAIRLPTNTEKLSALDPDARLDTGMKVKEALKRAEAWWSGKGAKQLRRKAKRSGVDLAFASLDPASENFIGSGILNGEPWDALTKREKLLAVKVWHHFFVRKPDLIGGANDAHRLTGKPTVN